MPNGHAYIVKRKQPNNSSGLEYHVLVDGKVIGKHQTQKEAAEWAKNTKKLTTHVSRVRDTGLEDPNDPAHWREYP